MPTRRREIELSVKRPLGPNGPAGGVARLSTRFEVAAEAEGPSPAELARALDELTRDLEGLLGPSLAALPAQRADRDLKELVETYRPRQRELVDLLLDDGELTPGEHARLLASLEETRRPSPPPVPSPAATTPVPSEASLAAVPIAAERGLPAARPVPELLRTYQIASLKQAGAVRARRQISFAEYMALKRHFEASPPGT